MAHVRREAAREEVQQPHPARELSIIGVRHCGTIIITVARTVETPTEHGDQASGDLGLLLHIDAELSWLAAKRPRRALADLDVAVLGRVDVDRAQFAVVAVIS